MTTHMRREIDEMPEAVARLGAPSSRERLAEVAALLKELDPPAVVTVARGSSDHAATYLKYAMETSLGRPVASVGPSVVTIQDARLRASGLAVLAISQSGASADLCALAGALAKTGGLVVAVTNTPASPLAAAASEVIDVAAGRELAVAATKSFLNSIVAGLWLVALWSGDKGLEKALARLPGALAREAEAADGAGLDALADAGSAFVIARGAALGLARETALKLMEACGIHASGYSAAEVLHGPSALIGAGFPVVALSPSAPGMGQATAQLARQGARVVPVESGNATGHPLVDPLLLLPHLYRSVEALSRSKGLSPDAPLHLEKATRTL